MNVYILGGYFLSNYDMLEITNPTDLLSVGCFLQLTKVSVTVHGGK